MECEELRAIDVVIIGLAADCSAFSVSAAWLEPKIKSLVGSRANGNARNNSRGAFFRSVSENG